MSDTRTPGPWAATSSYGYPLDDPDSVFTDVTPSNAQCEQKLVATGITNPADAFIMAAAKDLYTVCEMMLFLWSASPHVAEVMKDYETQKQALIAALKKAEGK